MNKKTVLYTLSRAKSNGIINFVLSLKFEEEVAFSEDIAKNDIFYATRFFYVLEKNLHKPKHFLERCSLSFV